MASQLYKTGDVVKLRDFTLVAVVDTVSIVGKSNGAAATYGYTLKKQSDGMPFNAIYLQDDIIPAKVSSTITIQVEGEAKMPADGFGLELKAQGFTLKSMTVK